MSYGNETASASPVRQRVTLETLVSQISGLVDQASSLASTVERNADALCGPVPQETSDGRPDGPRNGKLEMLSQMLDMVALHQHRAHMAGSRIESVVLGDETAINKLSGGALVGQKDRY